MAEKKSNKPTFTFTKTERPAPKGELQKMAREYEKAAKEKKAKRRKKLKKYDSKKLKEIMSGQVGYSKGGIVDRQHLKGR